MHPYITQGLITARADDRRRAAAAARQARLASGPARLPRLALRRAGRPARPAVPVGYRAMSR